MSFSEMDEIVIDATNLGKCYQIYSKPIDRLKQSLCRHRKKFYREFWAIRDINLQVRRGETLGIIGSNGSGKTTLLQVICGTLRPTTGHVSVKGRVAALLELGAGFDPEFTGRENVYINAAVMGLSQKEIDSRYEDIAEFADIGQFIEQPVKVYSSGMYLRLAFATAIHVSPDILVVDEALAVGDARFQQKCLAKIREFCKEGTVLFVTHSSDVVTELCNRALWIENGRVQMDGEPKAVVEKYLEFMYEGKNAFSRKIDISMDQNGGGPENTEGFVIINEKIRQFGNRRAVIEGVMMRCGTKKNSIAYTGQPCEISVLVSCRLEVQQPIIGFVVKDRLGRKIMADNTALILEGDLPPFRANQRYMLTFTISSWPNLREDDYSLSVAVADGFFDKHEQCHFLHDVIIFKSVPLRNTPTILSVPDTTIQFRQLG